MILILDNFDSFTYNLVDYFNQLNVRCRLYRNNEELSTIQKDQYRGIVLSPGPGIPAKSGNLMKVINHYHKHVPILGICLGHQAVGEYFGARLAKASKPMHGKISNINTDSNFIFKGFNNSLNVVRYHSLVLHDIPDCLTVTALTDSNEIMAISHKSLPISGLQFHPEAVMTDSGLGMLRNWVRFNNI